MKTDIMNLRADREILSFFLYLAESALGRTSVEPDQDISYNSSDLLSALPHLRPNTLATTDLPDRRGLGQVQLDLPSSTKKLYDPTEFLSKFSIDEFPSDSSSEPILPADDVMVAELQDFFEIVQLSNCSHQDEFDDEGVLADAMDMRSSEYETNSDRSEITVHIRPKRGTNFEFEPGDEKAKSKVKSSEYNEIVPPAALIDAREMKWLMPARKDMINSLRNLAKTIIQEERENMTPEDRQKFDEFCEAELQRQREEDNLKKSLLTDEQRRLAQEQQLIIDQIALSEQNKKAQLTPEERKAQRIKNRKEMAASISSAKKFIANLDQLEKDMAFKEDCTQLLKNTPENRKTEESGHTLESLGDAGLYQNTPLDQSVNSCSSYVDGKNINPANEPALKKEVFQTEDFNAETARDNSREVSEGETEYDEEGAQLLQIAVLEALSITQRQSILTKIENSTNISEHLGLNVETFPDLVENNPLVAVEILLKMANTSDFESYLPVLVNMKVSVHSMEVVNRLTSSINLPTEFLQLFISNCISTCGTIADKYIQSRLVRLVCVFLQSLMRNRTIDFQILYVEIMTFCLEFSRIREATVLYKLMKQMEIENFGAGDGPQTVKKLDEQPTNPSPPDDFLTKNVPAKDSLPK